MNYPKGMRVEHIAYGFGTIVRTTNRPFRVWIKWDFTGKTTPVSPDTFAFL